MTAPHDRMDELFNQHLNEETPATAVDNEDAQMVQRLVAHYQLTQLSATKQRRILEKATLMSQEKSKRKPQQFNWLAAVAVLVLVFGVVFFYLAPTQPATELLYDSDPLFEITSDISDAFGFEYGTAYGQVDNMLPAAEMMSDAGIEWVSFYVRYDPANESQRGAILERIQTAHDAGFKVLITLTGDADTYNSEYRNAYVDFAGWVAIAGADAIQVWDRPNLATYFPKAYNTFDSYAYLLEETSQVVRSTRRDTLIISSAPAPTGAQEAFPDTVVNDDNFLLDLAEQGALDYVDCVGMRYMEGTVSPLAVSGDARDDHYSRYLPMQLQRYREVTGASVPICVTAIGYLSLEGETDIPQAFDWATTTSREEQRQWTGDALEWLSLQADVQMAIVFNLDLESSDTVTNGYRLLLDH